MGKCKGLSLSQIIFTYNNLPLLKYYHKLTHMSMTSLIFFTKRSIPLSSMLLHIALCFIMFCGANTCGSMVCTDASYRNVLSANILSLQEKGKLTALKDKWWKEKRGGGACQVGVLFYGRILIISSWIDPNYTE